MSERGIKSHVIQGEVLTEMFNTGLGAIIVADDYGHVTVALSHALRALPEEERNKALMHFAVALRLETGWRPEEAEED